MTKTCTSTNFSAFNGKTRPMAEQLVEIVNSMAEHWPLTVRQVYYQAMARRLCENGQSAYAKISRTLTTLRKNDLIPWDAFEDRSRRTIDKRGLSDLQAFVDQEIKSILNPRHYHRCYVQQQSTYVEVSTEKDALSTILEDAIWYFCTRLVIVKGQCSTTVVEQMARRYEDAIMRGLRPVLVHFGDLDPTGIAAPKSIVRRLKEDHGIEVDYVRAALNVDQIERYHLPPNLTEAKDADPNFKAWANEFGYAQSTYECDALHPADLKQVLKNTLMSIYDMSGMQDQIAREEEDRRKLVHMRHEVLSFMRERFPSVMAFESDGELGV